MGLCHRPAAWSYTPQGSSIPPSIPERKVMEDYIKEALQQQLIRPSTSPAASSFFFVGKKDGGLRPCIDYRTLNDRTVKLPYPLPLVLSALEELRGPASSRRWTCGAPITSFVSGKATSGDSVHYPLRPLWISGYAVWPFQLPVRLLGVYERGVPGVPISLVCTLSTSALLLYLFFIYYFLHVLICIV